MAVRKRPAAPDLILFLPLALCEGQTACIPFFVNTQGRVRDLFLFFSERTTASIKHSASAADDDSVRSLPACRPGRETCRLTRRIVKNKNSRVVCTGLYLTLSAVPGQRCVVAVLVGDLEKCFG